MAEILERRRDIDHRGGIIYAHWLGQNRIELVPKFNETRNWINRAVNTPDSPIESLFYQALLWFICSKAPTGKCVIIPQSHHVPCQHSGSKYEIEFHICPQFETLGYRLDFAAWFVEKSKNGAFKSTSKFCIECDGHDFHEKTKEQAAHDKKRDRQLADDGWLVLRFTGAEIWKDALECAGEAFDSIAKSKRKEGSNG